MACWLGQAASGLVKSFGAECIEKNPLKKHVSLSIHALEGKRRHGVGIMHCMLPS